MNEKKASIVLPGDKLASIEEFIPGTGTVTVGDSIVSTNAGGKNADMANRVVSVKPLRFASQNIPKVGDYVIGFVDSASPSMAQITVRAINDLLSNRQFSAMLSLRDDRRRKSSPVKPADTIRAKVISMKNSIIHLAIADRSCGVINTVCSNCGGQIVPLGSDRVKCPECGLVDDRLLAEDLLRPTRPQARV